MVVGSLLVATGCGNQEEDQKQDTEPKVLTCTGTMDVQGIDMDLNYKVTYVGDYVTLVESEETVNAKDKKTLNTFKKSLEDQYGKYKDVEHYDYDITVDGTKLVSKVTINYEKIDVNKMLEIDENNGVLIKDGKIKVDDIRAAYELVGTECK